MSRARGAYVARLDLAQPHLAGVADKIRAQKAVLERLPADVATYHLRDGAIIRDERVERPAGKGSLAYRLAHYVFFHLHLASRTGPLDFLYLRYQGSSPLFIWMLRRLRKQNPRLVILLEFPSWPYSSEAVSLRERLLLWVDRRSRKGLQRHVDRIVTFSRDPTILGIPTIRTDNGVSVGQLEVLPDRPRADGLRLVGLANLSFWHGYDRIIDGMADYYARGGSQDVSFDVVGTGGELARLQGLVERHGLADRVRFHGPRRGPELEAILARADVGISSIGMHRLEVDTSNLKSREFCARGLPFVIGYEDRDFPNDLQFVFQAPADDSPIDIDALLGFHLRLGPPSDYRSTMRGYAESNLDWAVKMAPVVDALRQMMDEHRALR